MARTLTDEETYASWFRRKAWRNEHPTEVLPDAGAEHDPTTRTALVDALADTGPEATRRPRAPLLRRPLPSPTRPRRRRRPTPWEPVMTERLSVLLREEATAIDVPPPTVDDVLRDGHAQRRRRRIVGVTGAMSVAAAVVAVAVVAIHHAEPDPARRGSGPRSRTSSSGVRSQSAAPSTSATRK